MAYEFQLVIDSQRPHELADWWAETLGWAVEPQDVKDRLHIDVRIGDDEADAVVAKLTARGAAVLHTGMQGPHAWTTLADPEGNEFCVG